MPGKACSGFVIQIGDQWFPLEGACIARLKDTKPLATAQYVDEVLGPEYENVEALWPDVLIAEALEAANKETPTTANFVLQYEDGTWQEAVYPVPARHSASTDREAWEAWWRDTWSSQLKYRKVLTAWFGGTS